MTTQQASQAALTDCPYCGHPIGDNERQHIHRAEAERERHLRESLERDYQQRLKEGIDAERDCIGGRSASRLPIITEVHRVAPRPQLGPS